MLDVWQDRHYRSVFNSYRGFVVRVFIIQRDFARGSFFRARWVNDAVRVLVMTKTGVASLPNLIQLVIAAA